MLGFEVFGGFGAETLELLSLAARHKNNKLSHAEHDLTSWSARSWFAYQIQLISVRLTKAVVQRRRPHRRLHRRPRPPRPRPRPLVRPQTRLLRVSCPLILLARCRLLSGR